MGGGLMGLLADPVTAAAIGGGATLLVALAGVGVLAFLNRGSARVRRRLHAFVRMGERGGAERRDELRRRQIQSKLKSIEKRRAQQAKSGVQAMISRAGYRFTPARFLMGSVGCGVVLTLGAAVFGMGGIGLVSVFFAGVLFVPRFWLKRAAAKRMQSFTAKFPDAVDIVVRGLRSGLPLQECFRVIAKECPAPVGPEFGKVMDELGMGIPVSQALERAMTRMPTHEMKFFAIVIAAQQQTGGNLAEVLGSISRVLRGRSTLKMKIKALSSESRAAAMIIGSLPPLVVCVLFVMNPHYAGLLFETKAGNVLVGIGLAWMSIGIFIMKKMTDIKA